jgi:hypothetical protein
VDEAANERACLPLDDLLLPGREDDRALVLAARPDLRNQARPVLRVRPDLDTSGALDDADAIREHPTDHLYGLSDQIGISAVLEDAHAPHPAPGGTDRPITEIEPEHVRVGRLVQLSRAAGLAVLDLGSAERHEQRLSAAGGIRTRKPLLAMWFEHIAFAWFRHRRGVPEGYWPRIVTLSR